MNKIDFLQQLNNEQYDAATSTEGPLLIIAGAGSGKTLTLVSRVAYMIHQGIDPSSILLLTFTNKAAKEMKQRIIKHIGAGGEQVMACTFHSFCANFLRRHAHLMSIDNNFTIIDSVDAAEVMSIAKTEFISEQKSKGIIYDAKDFPSKKDICSLYSFSINNGVKLYDVVFANGFYPYYEEIKEVITRYVEYKKARSFFDYDDLLLYTKRILKSYEHVRKNLGDHFKYVACDEYQDSNILQDDILNLLCRDHQNLAVVGDDNQSIYKFRGAHIENILTFEKRYPQCKKVVLNQNYRSSQEILDLANSVMDYATEGIPKKLIGQFHGVKPQLIGTEDNDEETQRVFSIVQMHKSQGVSYRDMAVIVRNSSQSYALENMLTRAGIPFEKFGGLKFMEKIVVRDILSFLRLIVNPKDEIAMYRILQLYPGIGKTYSQRITSAVAERGIDELQNLYERRQFHIYLQELYAVLTNLQTKNLQEQLEYLIENYYVSAMERSVASSKMNDSDKMESRKKMYADVEDVKVLYEMASKYRRTSAFLEDLALDASGIVDTEEKLNITTIHSAKGLEYRVVIVMDVIEQITPKCEKNSDEDPEELRCFYVAITRAKEYLYLIIPMAHTSPQFRIYNASISHFIDYDDVLNTLDKKITDHKLSFMRRRHNIWSIY